MMGIPHPTPDVVAGDVRSERRFRLLAEAIPQIVWTTRPDGYCDYHNGRWFDYSGMTAEESSGTGWMGAVHPEDRTRLGPAWARTFEGSRGFELEYRLRRADGVYRWFLAQAEPICDDEGKVVRWFGTCTDIDDRKRAEDETLRRNADRLRFAAEAARLGYWDWDIPSDAITWSESLEEISATSPRVFGGTMEGFLALVHPDDRERVGASVRAAVDRGTPHEEEFRLARPDGTYRWCLTKGQAYHDRDGRAVRMSGIDVDISARKESEERLRRSEERFRASVDTLIDCFAIYTAIRDERGRITDFRTEYVNLPACRNNFMTREQQVGRGLLELLPAHRESGLFDRYCRVVETGEPLDIEEMFYEDAFDGERLNRVFAIRVSKLDDGYVAAWRDITDRKRAEEAVRENERRFRKLADSNILGVVFADVHGGISYANDEYLRILGYTREEFESRRIGWATVTPPEGLAIAERVIAQARRGDGACPPFEKEYIRKDGTRTPVLVGFTLFGAEESIAFVLDISERKRAEAALREGEERLSLAIEGARLGVWDWDIPSGKVLWNRHHETIFGYDPGKPLRDYRDFADRIHPDDLAALEARFREGMEGTGDYRYAYRVIWPSGTVRWVEGQGRFYRDADGHATRSLGVLTDITELKRAEEALREADRRKDEFLAMLAHELRNPLSALGNALRLIRAPGVADGDRELASDIADRQLQNLVRLIDDLLDVARISTGKILLQRVRLDASTIVARAVESVRPFIESRGQGLTISLEAGPLPLDGDPTRLEQVLANLLNNAGKYTDEGGRIRVVAGIEGTEVVIRVRDTGVGIAAEMLPGVFDLFAQVDASIARSQGGLGIGLAIVRMLVEMHGGRVSATSGGPGKGSEFTVRLPLPHDEAGAGIGVADPTTASAPRRAGPCRILLVDDNIDTLKSMAILLEHSGHEVVRARDGRTALEAAREFRPEVVLLDIGLPGMSGYEVAEAMRCEGMTDVLLIAVSGYAQEKDRERSRRAGFQHHLGKPVALDTLLALIEGPGRRTGGGGPP